MSHTDHGKTSKLKVQCPWCTKMVKSHKMAHHKKVCTHKHLRHKGARNQAAK